MRTTQAWVLALFVLVAACRSRDGAAPAQAPATTSQNANAKEPDPAANAPEEPKRSPNIAAAIAAITKDLPVYPNAKVHIPGVWSSPMEMRPNTWTSSYEANTPDPMEKVLAWYEKEMKAHGWIGHPSFKGMMGFLQFARSNPSGDSPTDCKPGSNPISAAASS